MSNALPGTRFTITLQSNGVWLGILIIDGAPSSHAGFICSATTPEEAMSYMQEHYTFVTTHDFDKTQGDENE